MYVGAVVRLQVDINIESWDVVKQGLKDVIWDDIKNHWKLDDSHKKYVFEKAGKQWRDFKGKLTAKFLHKGKDPSEVYTFISQEQWEIFKKRRETVEFKGELQRQVTDGSWTPQGHDDILSRALGRKEHGGRVRGVGGGAKIKEVFGSGTSKQSAVVSVDELATITQEITKKVQKECDEMMNEMMNLKLQGMFNQLKQMGVSLPNDNFVNDIGTPINGTVRSSCQSVDRQDHFSNLKIPTLGRLWVIHLEKGRVVVARGSVSHQIVGG